MAGMSNIIGRIEALLANTPQSEIEEFEVTRCLRDCRDEIIAARACAEMMLQGTGQRLAEGMAERVINGQAVGAWIAVSERMPADGEWVWCYGPNRGCEAACISKYWDGWVGTDRKNLVAGAYTHWMPLPPEPSEAAR